MPVLDDDGGARRLRPRGPVSRSPLRLAVVGHANTGKTSLLQTLLRRRDFGEVSATSGTTRAVEVGEVVDGDGVIAVLLDTPGLEMAERLRDAIESTCIEPRDDWRTPLDRFLASPAAADDDDLGQEAASVRAALDADVLLYVIDAHNEPKPKHRDELFVLAATARPVIPVLNYSARPDALSNRWRSVCADESVHTTVEFDAVVYDDAGEQRLLKAVNALDIVKASVPDLDDAIQRWNALRERERRQNILVVTNVAAEFLVAAAAAVVVTEPKKRNRTEREVAVEAATAWFLRELREREIGTRDQIAAALGFFGGEAQAVKLDVEKALGGVDFLSRANLLQHARIVTAAAAGAGVGATVDIAVGGLSLGGAAVLGGAAGATVAGSRKALRWFRGQDVLQLREDVVGLLAARAVATVRAMLARGHAAVEPVSIEATVNESLASDAGSARRASWRKARGRAAWSDLSRPRPNDVGGYARAETVKKVAAALADELTCSNAGA